MKHALICISIFLTTIVSSHASDNQFKKYISLSDKHAHTLYGFAIFKAKPEGDFLAPEDINRFKAFGDRLEARDFIECSNDASEDITNRDQYKEFMKKHFPTLPAVQNIVHHDDKIAHHNK